MTQLEEAIELLKECVNWYDRPMQIGIGGKRGEEIRAFIQKTEGEDNQ